MTAVSLRSVTVEYPGDGYVHRPIDQLDTDIADGSLTLLLGPSGCGKTTLLSCIGGLLRPAGGRVLVDDQDLCAMNDEEVRAYRRDTAGFVFQSYNLIPSLNARDNVAAPLIALGASRHTARERADSVLAEVGMEAFGRKRPGNLSGGQQQRVAVARGLAHGPGLLLADEPTANLDFVQAEAVIALLRNLTRPGRTVIISTHDDRLLPIADAVIDLTPRLADTVSIDGPVTLAAGEELFHQGERGSLVYAVTAGQIDLVQRDGSEHLVATIGPGQYFGELSPMMGQPRTATARAATPVTLEAMTLQNFRVRGRQASYRGAQMAEVPTPERGRRRRRQLVADPE